MIANDHGCTPRNVNEEREEGHLRSIISRVLVLFSSPATVLAVSRAPPFASWACCRRPDGASLEDILRDQLSCFMYRSDDHAGRLGLCKVACLGQDHDTDRPGFRKDFPPLLGWP